MTPDEWLDVAATWARLWPNRPLPPESIEPWYDLLADLDGETVRRALLGWAADPDRSWPPQSPGELRDAALPDDEDWTEAIAILAREVRRRGRYDPPRDELDDGLAGYVESVGGWTRLCQTFDPADPTQRAQFRDYWRTMRRRVRREEANALAAGIAPALPRGGTDGDRPALD